MAKKEKFDLKETLKTVQKKQKTKPKKSKHPVLEGFNKEVDKIINIKKDIKTLNVQLDDLKVKIQDAALEHRVKNQIQGTIEFEGKNGSVQDQESEKFSMKIEVDSELDELLQEIVGKKYYKENFEIKRNISVSKEILEDEKKLSKLIKLIHENFGLDGLDVNQYVYPNDKFSSSRYKQFTLEQQKEIDELIKTTRVIK